MVAEGAADIVAGVGLGGAKERGERDEFIAIEFVVTVLDVEAELILVCML